MIKHSTTPNGYRLSAHGRPLGNVVKEDGTYSVVDGEAFALLDTVSFPTMKALKETLYEALPMDMRSPLPKVDVPTNYAMRQLGGSHSRTSVALKDAAELFPEKRNVRGWLQRFTVRRYYELAASFPWGDRERAWLEANPHYGTYDHAEFMRRVARRDGPVPSYCL